MLGSPYSSIVDINLLARNLSTSSLVIPGVSGGGTNDFHNTFNFIRTERGFLCLIALVRGIKKHDDGESTPHTFIFGILNHGDKWANRS